MEGEVDGWVKLVSTVGFPIAVAAYLLIRLETTIKDLTRTMNRLILVLAKRGIDLPDENEK
jgi:hypothetical protein